LRQWTAAAAGEIVVSWVASGDGVISDGERRNCQSGLAVVAERAGADRSAVRKKITTPVGVPPLPATVAVKVTGWPATLGFGDEARVVVDDPRLMDSMKGPLLPLKLPSPL
jgi:hypothetical protein